MPVNLAPCSIIRRRHIFFIPGLFLGSTVSAMAQEGTARPGGTAPSVDQLWRAWLRDEGKRDGENRLPDGTSSFISHASVRISAKPGDRNWVAAKTAAFESAELLAREALASTVGARLKSDRSFLQGQQGGQNPPPAFVQATRELSNAERLRTLTGRALDEAIRQFDPTWDGTGQTEEQRQARAVRAYMDFRARIASRSAVYVAGAVVPVQFEGNDPDGKLTVLVAMAWSERLARISEGLWAPIVPEREAPDRSIAARVEEEERRDPAWLASANGVRLWRDERGETVLVAFGAVGTSSVPSADVSRAKLYALAAMQRFVGEQIAAGQDETSSLSFRETADGRQATFDNATYQQVVRARAAEVTISGAEQVADWRGRHPQGEVPMQVVAMAWSPSRNAGAQALGARLSEAEEKARRAAVPPGGGDMGAGAPGAATPGTAGTAVPPRTGPRSDRGLY